MRKILFIIISILITNILSAQIVTYGENNNTISNPERGLQKYSISTNGLLNHSTLSNWRSGSDKVTVVYRYFLLPFNDIPLTTLNNIQTDLNTVRDSGLKIIIRFSYTNTCNTDCVNGTIPQQPSKSQIVSHINQLSNVINNNKDIILSIQVGFIGTWGEFYYTGSSEFGHAGSINATQWNNRKDIINLMINSFHQDIPLQVRYANAKRLMYGNSIPTTFGQDRVGFYNDAFLNSWGDMGTYSITGQFTNPVGSNDYDYVSNTSRFLPMTGETNGLNPPRTEGSNVITEMNLLHFTTLNRDYYTPNWNNWISSGHYNEIVNRLGYRIVLNSSTLVGNNLELKVSNVGFGNILFEKKLFLIFRGTSDIKRLIDFDVRNITKGNHTINITIPSDIPTGNYELLLQIADKNLETRPEYSIQFANTGLWEDTTGFNRLNLNYEVTSTCTTTTIWNGITWSNGFPTETRNVILNSPYSGFGFTCCSLTNNSNLIITPTETIAVVQFIQNNGNITVQSGGQLIPLTNTTTSTGPITVQRQTTPMKRFDYTYFSSPVSNATIGSVVGAWQQSRTYSFVTENFFDVETVFQNGNPSLPQPDGQDDDGNAWLLTPQNLIMGSGEGYISMIRSAPNTPPYPRTELLSFTGELNTGVITFPLKFSANSSATNDDFNLVGNPYSAAINANDLIDQNITRINGTLSFWTHSGTQSPNYSGLEANNFSNQDYAYYTKLGGTTSSFGGRVPNNIIGSGQGFIVEAELEQDLVFTPSMMSVAYQNNTSTTFFRTSTQTNDVRVWLNLHTTDNELFSQQLIGYNSQTTKEYERGWDSKIRDARMSLKFYSFDDNSDKNDIQARGGFDILDEVDLGYFSAIEGELTISLGNIEGLEGVYIKDGDNICELPYTFYTEIGEFNNRFKLVYTNVLSINDFNNEVYIIPNPTHGLLQIMNLGDRRVNIYDSLGREVNFYIYNNIVDISYLSNGVYFLIITGYDEKIKIIKK